MRERESIYLYLERYVCLRCIDEEKKKIKYVNKIWFYLVYFMMLLGERRKKKRKGNLIFFLYKKVVFFYLSLINFEVINIVFYVLKFINKIYRSNYKFILGVVV